ncbi:MAG: PQQ-dependent sugar dehydrogenase [Bdellovibrionota bacterium]|nr:MAG: PQQ-dependent sugar dehydrogenase [Bdellovibrionota bacterium]
MKKIWLLAVVASLISASLFAQVWTQAPTGPVPISNTVPEASGYRIESYIQGLEHPWSLAFLPDGRILVTERPGRLRVINGAKLEAAPIGGTPKVFASGQGGLLDVSAHPRFHENSIIYLTYSAGSAEANRTSLVKARLLGGELKDSTVIFQVAEPKAGAQHFGSRISWLDDTSFLMSIGDGGNPPATIRGELSRNQAQNEGMHFGKIIRLDENGNAIPPGPFKSTHALPELWTIGHRNIQGLFVDRESKRVWATEHGSRGGDELNLIVRGGNYGWPLVTYSLEYFGPRISDKTSAEGFIDPKLVWTPSIAPSGLLLYSGDAFPSWRGNLFSGNLAGAQIRRIILTGDTVTGEEMIPVGKRVRDVRQGPDGLIYLLTDQPEGEVLRLIPDPATQ